jgi:pyridoxal phosphate enzyme (YggS family)
MRIAKNIKSVTNIIPNNVKLVAVSKTKSINLIESAYRAGQRDFGENKVQELVNKFENLPKDINWHMIGHLQRNKVKYIAPFIYLIQSVDSLRLLIEINKQGIKNNRVINVLVQMDISNDETKFGFSFQEFEELINKNEIKTLKNICIKGMMGMASFTKDENKIKDEFYSLHKFYKKYKKFLNLEILSMGMSGDFKIAINCNSNLIRLGSSIFGDR